jgi:hypothetical protein
MFFAKPWGPRWQPAPVQSEANNWGAGLALKFSPREPASDWAWAAGRAEKLAKPTAAAAQSTGSNWARRLIPVNPTSLNR